MASHAQVAASVRAQKEASPRKYCENPGCLFRIVQRDGSSTPCPKHGRRETPPVAGATRPSLRSWLEQLDTRREIAPALDDVAYADVVREVLQAVSKNPDIKRCDLWSIKRAIARAVSWDLVIGDRCFLIPRRDEENGAWRLHAVQGYRGKIEILVRNGVARVIDASPVYANEVFSPRKGTHPSIDHTPILAPEDRGPLVGAYAFAKLSQTDYKIEVISAEEIDAIRMEYSRDWSDVALIDVPWYAAKTAVHRLANQLPMSPRVAALLDDRMEPAPAIEPGSPAEKALLTTPTVRR